VLVPAIGDVVLKVDLEGQTMIVDPPEGLYRL
jgi:ribosomal 30S subunit maturation factor RimM